MTEAVAFVQIKFIGPYLDFELATLQTCSEHFAQHPVSCSWKYFENSNSQQKENEMGPYVKTIRVSLE